MTEGEPMRSTSNTRARNRGFTIMEVMFTVSIAAVLMAVAVPSFRSLMANNRLASQSTELVAAINFARSEAISRNATISVCRANLEASTNCAGSAGEWDFFIVRRDTAPTGVLRRGALPDYGGTVSFESDLTADRITFSPDGLARSGGALVSDREFTVCSTAVGGQNMRVITVGAGSRLSTIKDEGDCS
jgi:type IV fimbrial biogenesis protein FimT